LETRTNRGFPHFHSDYGAGTRFDRKADPAKIAGPVRFLHRTGNVKPFIQDPLSVDFTVPRRQCGSWAGRPKRLRA
jgi:hypothetical protein